MKYVLLLRGINVGGKNKVSMKDLKMNIGELGYQNVVTYINSGNVIFDTDDNTETVKIKIAEMLKNVFFPIQHVIITREEYLEEVSNRNGGMKHLQEEMFFFIVMRLTMKN